jgi:hypothetical protein
MRPDLLAALTLLACSAHQPTPSPDGWTTVASSGHVRVDVERALYETTGTNHFFVRVRVTNTSQAEVGVDLRAYHQVFYPNQWGASPTEHRTVIDETRLVVGPLDTASAAALLADDRAGSFTRIAAGTTLEYFDEFNASSRADVDAQTGSNPYVIVTMDGQLRLSDGTVAERVLPSGDDGSREVAIHAPIAWKPIPPGARVIVDR